MALIQNTNIEQYSYWSSEWKLALLLSFLTFAHDELESVWSQSVVEEYKSNTVSKLSSVHAGVRKSFSSRDVTYTQVHARNTIMLPECIVKIKKDQVLNLSLFKQQAAPMLHKRSPSCVATPLCAAVYEMLQFYRVSMCV